MSIRVLKYESFTVMSTPGDIHPGINLTIRFYGIDDHDEYDRKRLCSNPHDGWQILWFTKKQTIYKTLKTALIIIKTLKRE